MPILLEMPRYSAMFRSMGFGDAVEFLRFYYVPLEPMSPWQDKKEIVEFLDKVLVHFDGRNITNIMEIGSHIGGTLALLTKLITPGAAGHVISIEPELDIKFQRHRVKLLMPAEIPLVHIPLLSQSELAVCMVHSLVDKVGLFDVLFIDGGHTYEYVMADYRNYSDCVSEHGVVAFHDATYQTVRKAFDEIVKSGEGFSHYEIIDHTPELPVMGIGVLYK